MKKIDINIINNWPKSWAGDNKDVEYGKRIVKLMRPFIEQLLGAALSQKTIRNYIDDLWVLGGYIIKRINDDEEEVTLEPCLLLPRYIDSYDGPRIHDFSEYEQMRFDRTCRKFYRFLVENILRNYHNS